MFEFKSEVRVEIYSHLFSTDYDPKVDINWTADFEVREFGIKTIYAYCKDEDIEVEVEVELTEPNEAKGLKVIKLNPSKLNVTYTGNERVLCPERIDIWVDEDGQVDYSKSEIEFNT